MVNENPYLSNLTVFDEALVFVSQREFMKKIAVIKRSFMDDLYFSLCELPENGLGVLFFRKQLVTLKKNEKKIPRIRQTRKGLSSRRNGNRQTRKMAGNSWSRGHFRRRVSRKRDAKRLQ